MLHNDVPHKHNSPSPGIFFNEFLALVYRSEIGTFCGSPGGHSTSTRPEVASYAYTGPTEPSNAYSFGSCMLCLYDRSYLPGTLVTWQKDHLRCRRDTSPSKANHWPRSTTAHVAVRLEEEDAGSGTHPLRSIAMTGPGAVRAVSDLNTGFVRDVMDARVRLGEVDRGRSLFH